MDWYPLWNSLRIALISCAAVFFLGIFAAYYIAKLPRTVKGVLDVVLTLPMVLPLPWWAIFFCCSSAQSGLWASSFWSISASSWS